MNYILIRGMEMPKNCSDCWAVDDYGDYPRCRITEEQRGYNFPIREKRMDKCPLVPVPPHGRLGDLDEVDRKLFEEQCRTSYSDVYGIGISDGLSLAREEIETAPTILEAEEGE